MRPLEAPKLKVDKSKSEVPNRHRKVPGMIRRLRRPSILNRVVQLGQMSDAAVIQHGRSEGLLHDLAFKNHQQKFWGSLDRLLKAHFMGMLIPTKIESSRLQSAHKAQEERR